MTDPTTRDRILDEAVRLFAQHGFEGTSMRNITQAAGVNLASVNYHFGSKTGLLREAMRRRIEPVNAERVRRLDAAIAAAGGGTPSLETIIDAFIRPAVEEFADLDPSHFMGMVQMLYSGEVGPDFFRELFGPLVQRFNAVLHEAAPQLGPLELAWRLHFLVGAMMQAFNPRTCSVHPHLARLKGPELVEVLVRWATAGFLAAPVLEATPFTIPPQQENPA